MAYFDTFNKRTIRTTHTVFPKVALISIRHAVVCPAHVARFVIAVIIYSIQHMLWRALSYAGRDIGKEIYEIAPTSTNSYAAAAIVFIVATGRSITSMMYVLPCAIEGMSFFSCAMTMKIFSASARNSVAAPKVISTSNVGITAVAFALPKYVIANIFANWLKRNQAAKSLICDTQYFWHLIKLLLTPTLMSAGTITEERG